MIFWYASNDIQESTNKFIYNGFDANELIVLAPNDISEIVDTETNASTNIDEDNSTSPQYSTTSRISFNIRNNDQANSTEILTEVRKKNDNHLQKKKKKKKKKDFSSFSTSSSSSLECEPEETSSLFQRNLDKIPFCGRAVSLATDLRSIQDASNKKDEWQMIKKKYLTPLLIEQDRLEKIMKSLYANQVKNQKALQKRQVCYSLRSVFHQKMIIF